MNAPRLSTNARCILIFSAVVLTLTGLSAIPDIARSINGETPAPPGPTSLLWAIVPIAAVVAALKASPVLELEEFRRWLTRRRISACWLTFAILGAALQPALLATVVHLTNNLAVVPSAAEIGRGAGAAAPLIIAASVEEIGWRGFLLPTLQTRMSALAASLLVGLLWMIWHLPLTLQGGPNSHVPLWWYPIITIAASVGYTAIYNATRGTVLVTAAIHGTLNIVTGPVVQHLAATGQSTTAFYASAAVLYLIAAIALPIVLGPRNLARVPRQQLSV
ncbi:MAG: protease family protein [Actinomycetota bacterium]|jgi:membrane protease YdiL (CAAX protease family)